MSNAFSIEDLWRNDGPPLFHTEEDASGLFSSICTNTDAPETDFVAALAKRLAEELVLPSLDSLNGESLGETNPSVVDSSSPSPELHLNVTTEPDSEFELDVWDYPLLNETRACFAWETFSDPQHEEPASTYLSEVNGDIFDGPMGAQVDIAGDFDKIWTNAIQSGPLLEALFSVAKGGANVFFDCDEAESDFRTTLPNMRITDHSLQGSQALFQTAVQCGNQTRQLRAFIARTYRARTPFPSLVALAKAIGLILSAIEAHLTHHARHIRSYAQLHAQLEAPKMLLQGISQIVERARKCTSDSDVATRVYERLGAREMSSAAFNALFKHVFQATMLPCLQRLDVFIGLSSDLCNPAAPSRDTPELPGFIDAETTASICSLGSNLHLLRTHLPNHPLCDIPSESSSRPQLELSFDWDRITQICRKAERYESELSAAVLAHSTESRYGRKRHRFHDSDAESATFNWDEFALQLEDIHLVAFATGETRSSDPIEQATHAALLELPHRSDLVLEPELSMCPSLSLSPFILAQTRLVNAAVVRLIMRSKGLRDHLEVQYMFHLLGSGAFISRLVPALFDPTRSTTERQKGIVRAHESLGLRLGTRKTWPPASSELQLALMGILADSYTPAFTGKLNHALGVKSRGGHQLPGNLSFAVRQLPTEEADRCMDANSLYALDFLRLQYTPPEPIDAVITAEGLGKYDTIFKMLLRLQRMAFVVSRLPRDSLGRLSLKFGFEARHFVTACVAHFHGTGVTEAWCNLRNFFDAVEGSLAAEDRSGQLSQHTTHSLHELYKAHDHCLDTILSALLLRKRHAQVMKSLEDVFSSILIFAKDPKHEAVAMLHQDFTDKMGVFVLACQGLMGQQDKGGARGIERLLFALDTNRLRRT